MVGNWRQRKESGVDTKEGAIKVSVLKAVLFLWRGLKPPVNTVKELLYTVVHVALLVILCVKLKSVNFESNMITDQVK